MDRWSYRHGFYLHELARGSFNRDTDTEESENQGYLLFVEEDLGSENKRYYLSVAKDRGSDVAIQQLFQYQFTYRRDKVAEGITQQSF